MADATIYGITHPVLSADISEAYIGRQVPIPQYGIYGNYYGTNGVLGAPNMNGTLCTDKVEISKKTKDKRFFGKLLSFIAIATGAILVFKGGKKLFPKIVNLFKKK